MSERNSDEELKLNRRLFLQFAAATAVTAVGAAGVLLKTDALAQNPANVNGGGRGTGMPYPYL